MQDFVQKLNLLRQCLANTIILAYSPVGRRVEKKSGTRSLEVNVGEISCCNPASSVALLIKTDPQCDIMHEQHFMDSRPVRFERQHRMYFSSNSLRDEPRGSFEPLSACPAAFPNWLLGDPNNERQKKAAQIHRLVSTWNQFFQSQPLPAVILCYAIRPPEAALCASVLPLDYASHLWTLQSFKQHLGSCCSGVLEFQMPDESLSDNINEAPMKSSTVEIDKPIIVFASQDIAEFVDSVEVRGVIHSLTRSQGFDPLSHLASACLMVMKSATASQGTTLQRYLMYLSHILRHSTHFSKSKIQEYIYAIATTMSHFQSTNPATTLLWSMRPQPMDSLHLKPGLRSSTDIFTFAASEALLLYPWWTPSDFEGGRRFTIAAHALSSWVSRLQYDHPMKKFEPSLDRRKEVLTYLLHNLVPPESMVGTYNLWTEALRLCNTGTVKEPTELLTIFIAASMRPILLWHQAFDPLVATGYCTKVILGLLKGRIKDAAAPELLMRLTAEIEQER